MFALAIAALYIAADLAVDLTKATILEKRLPNRPGSLPMPRSPLTCLIVEALQDEIPMHLHLRCQRYDVGKFLAAHNPNMYYWTLRHLYEKFYAIVAWVDYVNGPIVGPIRGQSLHLVASLQAPIAIGAEDVEGMVLTRAFFILIPLSS